MVQKHQKITTVTQLKRTYTILSTAIERAKSDYGDISEWGYIGYNNKINPEDNASKLQARELPYTFLKNYILPYLPVKKDLFMTLEELGYTSPVKYRNNTTLIPMNSQIHYIILNDGSTIMPNITSSATKDENGNKTILGYSFLIDINGKKGPNILGKDNFYTALPIATNAGLRLSGRGYSINYSKKKVTYYNTPREDLLDNCNELGNACSGLIQEDGWQIKNDYNW